MLKESTFIKIKYKKLFICAILGWLVALLGGMADSIIAGIYLDSEAVAAVSLVTPILSICYFFVMLLGPIVLTMPLARAGGFNAMSWGFALTPVFALAVIFLYFLFTKQLKNAPYLLKNRRNGRLTSILS